MRTHRLTSLSLLTLLGLSAAACTIRPEPEPDPEDLVPRTLYAFESCDDLLGYAKENAKEALDEYGYFYGGGGWGAEDDLDGGATGAESGGDGGDSGGEPQEPGIDYSGTNVQELGIDEPDLVKTDGERIVALAEGKLHYVDTTGSEPMLRSSLELGDLWGSEMFLYEDKALIFQRLYYWEGQALPADVQAWMNGEYGAITRITEIDLSNPDALKVVGNLYIRGDYVSARLFDSTSRIVLQSFPTGLAFKSPWEFIEELITDNPDFKWPETQAEWDALYAAAQAQSKLHNSGVIDESTVENWLPQYFFQDVAGGGVGDSSGLLYDCVDAMHPGTYSGLGVTSVLSVDLEKGLSPEGGIGVFAEGSIVYASAQNLYVATQPWFGQLWGGDGGIDGGGIDVEPEPIPDGGDPNTSVSTSASPGGAGAPAPDADLPAKFRADEEAGALSFVHKFELPAGEKAVYRASGEVRGRMLNQWAMSEHLGDLRVATTDQSGWDTSTSESFVSVLREEAGELVQIGQVGGLGAGEEIKSVRYIRDVAYVVTFRQTDPLYTVDLKDPSNPKVAGELKINGYSAYLHPLSDTHLIGVGYDGTDEGQLLGVQISLFDVSDLANPIRTHQHALGDFGSTEVAFDHKAFLYWDPTDLAVFPVQAYSWNEEDFTESYFFGAVAYTVDAGAGIELAGQITHMVDPQDPWQNGDPALRRSLVIGSRLYTVSDSGLKASDLGTLADVKWLDW